MRKELQELDKELKSVKDAVILRRDFQMFRRSLLNDVKPFILEIERVANKRIMNNISIIVALHE